MFFNKSAAKRKAVSPVVATVLLIAVAVSIGILVTTFVTSFVTTQTSGDITCAINTNYIIESAEFNKSGFNNTLLIKITNKNKNPIYGFGIIMDNSTKIIHLNSSNTSVNQGGISSINKLKRELSGFIQVNFTNMSMNYAFGNSLKNGDDIEVKILNDACPAVAASVKDVT